MKCCQSDCLMDAAMMPVVKKGSVDSFMDAAIAQLGLQRDEVLKDEAKRAQAIQVARSMAYQPMPEKGCCERHVPDVTKTCHCCESEVLTVVPWRAPVTSNV